MDVENRKVFRFKQSIKKKYREKLINSQEKWPPRHGEKLIRLVLVEREREDDYKHTKVALRRTSLKYNDIFKVEKSKVPVRRILAEGDAGIGKTTLCMSISEDWASGKLFQEFELLLHLPLREKSVASAGTLPDLLKLLHPKEDIRQAVTEYLEDEEGENVLVVADGWDELSEQERNEGTFLYDFLLGDEFQFLSVLLTSRPSASGKLHCHKKVNRIIEIRGFNEENIQEYVLSEFDNEQERGQKLVDVISGNIVLQSICVIPLNCAIICHLWRSLKEALPSTMTELYTKIILNFLLRSVQKLKKYEAITNLPEFAALPSELYGPWLLLCEFAFRAMERDEITFSDEEFSKSFPKDVKEAILSFGLLQFAKSIMELGSGVSLHFLHLTFQEYLAALHLVNQPPDTQLSVCKIHSRSSRFFVVWKFFFGIVFDKVRDPQPYFSTTADEFLMSRPINGSLLCHCALEARNDDFKRAVVMVLRDFRAVYPSTAYDCAAMFHTLSKVKSVEDRVNNHVNLHLPQCGLREKEVQLLAEVLTSIREKIDVTQLDIRNNDLSDVCVSTLLLSGKHTMNGLRTLNLSNNRISAESIASFSGLTPHNIKRLYLSYNPLGASGLKLLEDSVRACMLPSLKTLHLRGVGMTASIVDTLMQSLANFCSVENLDLSDNDLGVLGAVALGMNMSLFTQNRHCIEIRLNSVKFGDEGMQAFINNGKFNCDLLLHLKNNGISAPGLVCLLDCIHLQGDVTIRLLNLADNPLGLEGAIAFCKMLSCGLNRLEECDLSRCEFANRASKPISLIKSIYEHKLEYPRNRSICNLFLDGNCFTEEGIYILACIACLCPDVEDLSSCNCGITSDDLRVFLKELETYQRLTDCEYYLESWNLMNNSIDSIGVTKLVERIPNVLPQLKRIEISGNPVNSGDKRKLQELSARDSGMSADEVNKSTICVTVARETRLLC